MIKLRMPLLAVGSVLIALAASASAFGSDDGGVVRLSEPVEVTDSYETFGAPLPDSGDPIGLDELLGNSVKYLGQEVLVSTRIAKVCQKKGCFFVAQEGAMSARITFKDYGFFIPTDSGGKQVTLVGTLSRKAVSAEQAEHYAKDLGETPTADAPAFEYAIVASAVKIHRG